MKKNTVTKKKLANKSKKRRRKLNKLGLIVLFVAFLLDKAIGLVKKLFLPVIAAGGFAYLIFFTCICLVLVGYIMAYALYCSNPVFWDAIMSFNGTIINAFKTLFAAIG